MNGELDHIKIAQVRDAIRVIGMMVKELDFRYVSEGRFSMG